MHEYFAVIQVAPAIAKGFFPVGLKGFSDAIHAPALYLPLVLLAVVICCWLYSRLDLTASFALSIVGCLMISPYVTWYDSTLLVLPILFAYSRSNNLKPLFALVLCAFPLWARGGGNNGIGYMHIGVEALLMLWFTLYALSSSVRRLDNSGLRASCALRSVSHARAV